MFDKTFQTLIAIFTVSGGVWKYQILQGSFGVFYNHMLNEPCFTNASPQKRISEWTMP